MNVPPFISVIIPLYNKENEVLQAVGSVLGQSVAKFELIIVDDGSTDRSLELVQGLDDARIRLIRQTNAGVSAARNKGIDEAQGELIALIDADDYWKPNFLETVLLLYEKYPNCGVFGTSYFQCRPGGTPREIILRGLPPAPWEGVISDYFTLAARSDFPLSCSSIMLKKSAIMAVGGFPENIRDGEDLLTWARLACRYSVAYNQQPLVQISLPEEARDRSGRYIKGPDVVGQELNRLLKEATPSQVAGLRLYTAGWHQTRAYSHLQWNSRVEALKDIIRAWHYGAPRLKLLIIAGIAFFPGSMARFLLRKLPRFMDHCRRLVKRSA